MGTGGGGLLPDSLDQADSTTRTVARDIRSQYIIAYKLHNQGKPDYPTLHVEAHAPAMANLRFAPGADTMNPGRLTNPRLDQ